MVRGGGGARPVSWSDVVSSSFVKAVDVVRREILVPPEGQGVASSCDPAAHEQEVLVKTLQKPWGLEASCGERVRRPSQAKHRLVQVGQRAIRLVEGYSQPRWWRPPRPRQIGVGRKQQCSATKGGKVRLRMVGSIVTNSDGGNSGQGVQEPGGKEASRRQHQGSMEESGGRFLEWWRSQLAAQQQEVTRWKGRAEDAERRARRLEWAFDGIPTAKQGASRDETQSNWSGANNGRTTRAAQTAQTAQANGRGAETSHRTPPEATDGFVPDGTFEVVYATVLYIVLSLLPWD